MKIINTLNILSEISSTFSGNNMLHQQRVAVIAFSLAKELKLSKPEQSILFQAGLIHDIGILHEFDAEENLRMIMENKFWPLHQHAAVSAKISRVLNLDNRVTEAVELHHYAKKHNPSLYGRILFLSDSIEVSYRSLSNKYAFNVIFDFLKQKAKFFDEKAFSAFKNISEKEHFWFSLADDTLSFTIENIIDELGDEDADARFSKAVSYLIAHISDSRSSYLHGYSLLNKNLAAALAYKFDVDMEKIKTAALIAHAGNVMVPTELVDSMHTLEVMEKNIIKSHAYYTGIFSKRIGFDNDIVRWASYHHENISGTGYPFKISDFDTGAKILQISTIVAALLQDRAYRKKYDKNSIVKIIEELTDNKIVDKSIACYAKTINFNNIINTKDEYYSAFLLLFRSGSNPDSASGAK